MEGQDKQEETKKLIYLIDLLGNVRTALLSGDKYQVGYQFGVLDREMMNTLIPLIFPLKTKDATTETSNG